MPATLCGNFSVCSALSYILLPNTGLLFYFQPVSSLSSKRLLDRLHSLLPHHSVAREAAFFAASIMACSGEHKERLALQNQIPRLCMLACLRADWLTASISTACTRYSVLRSKSAGKGAPGGGGNAGKVMPAKPQ